MGGLWLLAMVVHLSAFIWPHHLLHADVYNSRNHSSSVGLRQCGQLIPTDLQLCLLEGEKTTKKSYQYPRQAEPVTSGKAVT